MLDQKLKERTMELIEKIPKLIEENKYSEGPELYFYQKTLSLRRQKSLYDLFADLKNRYIELIYATLVSWGMNSRGAKMKYFDNFRSSILDNKEAFKDVSCYVLDDLSEAEFVKVKTICNKIYSGLHLMKTRSRLVSNSKIMHFILPDLVMPMDRNNTLKFFYNNTGESKKRFQNILESSYYIAKRVNLRQYLDKKWNLSITKVIDNAIICLMNSTRTS